MAKKTARVNLRRAASNMILEVEVVGVRTFRLRLVIAFWLIRLAAKVGGVGIRIERKEKPNE